jgi:hypothetical protein
MTGWKSWSIGEVVDADDFQTYVQNQVVQNYADSTARTAALGTAVAEGMVAYLQDTNLIEVYDGSQWVNFTGDITGVTAGTALTGGGTSGNVTLNVDQSALTLAQSQVTNLVSDLAGKQATITGAATTITSSNLTASRALLSDGSGKVAVSAVTSTELGFVSGVTSAIQTQLNAKAPLTQSVDDKTANYTIVAGDNGKVIRLTGATGRTFTIANVLSIGQRIDFLQDGTGQITFAAGSGVTLRSVDNKLKTNKQYSGATVICVASGVYHIIGDVAA